MTALATFLRLVAEPAAVKHARDEVAAVARDWGLHSDGLETLRLLTSELVTNTLPVAEGQFIEVRVKHEQDCVVLDVWDPAPPISAGGTWPMMPAGMAASGRGLALVELLSSRWCERPSTGRSGKHLIAHVPLDPLGARCNCVDER